MDVIKPAHTEWASSIVFVPKHDDKICFCVDYRKLKAVTIRGSYLIPCMDKGIDLPGKDTILSTFDANCRCWQVEIAE